MKKLITAAVLLLTAALTASSVSAAEIGTEPAGVYAVVTDGEGSEQLGGAPDVSRVEDAQAYELYVDRKEVLSVGASGASDKRYHAEFTLPGTRYEVYLAGLRSGDVEAIQQEILAHYTEGERFDFDDLPFIDAEKLQPGNRDSDLCWAASCSNMLTYTGWAQQAGFADEDEVFDLYADSYSNNGGFQHDGLAWFFNGVALGTNSGYTSAKILDYPNTGGYFNNYAYDMVCNYEYIRSVTQLNHMEERLKSGCALSPGIDIYQNGSLSGSHAITLWGFVTDPTRDKTDISRFRHVFITDSDSDMNQPVDRSLAANVLNMMPTYENGKGQLCFDYEGGLTAAFEDFVYLLPYSRSLPRERDLATMRDKTQYPDLGFGHVTLTEKRYEVEQNTLYESGKKLYCGFDVENVSDKDYRAAVKVSRSVVNQNGESFLSGNVTLASRRLNMAESTDMHYDELTRLPAGDYTLTLKINENRPVIEAYYYNNTCTIDFKVRDSYLLGDCNGDGKLDVNDVTCIQRMLATIYSSEKAAERGNVDGGSFDINDATNVQFYLAKIPVTAPIGEKRLHSMI